MTVSRIVSGPTHETALAAGIIKTWEDARIGKIFISARNGNARNCPNSTLQPHKI
jgi:hypothetical protein